MSRPKHGGTFTVTARDAQGVATAWRAKCSCRESWAGPTYEVVEDAWRAHVYDRKGILLPPHGDKSGQRWSA